MKKLMMMISLTVATASLWAGGFVLELGTPSANAEAKAKNAFLVVRASGCHNPEKALVTATAEGVRGGQRQSIPLTLIPLSTPGMYAVTRQWPTEGNWAVALVGKDEGRTTSTIVQVGPEGAIRSSAKYFLRTPTADEVSGLIALRQ